MNAYLFPALEAGPRAIAAIASALTLDRLDTPTHEGRFTPREVVAHLAHWESILREERIVVPAATDGVAILAYDEGELAVAHNYAQSDVDEQLKLFRSERAKTIALLQSLTQVQFNHAMVHPERGVCSVMDLANLLIGHDMYHVDQLSDCLVRSGS